MGEITITVEQLESLLDQQKHATAEYITRNLSVYSFFSCVESGLVNIDQTKKEMKEQCIFSPFANDFKILKKYHK